MKTISNYKELYEINNELRDVQVNCPHVMKLWMSVRIANFKKKNEATLNLVGVRLTELYERHVKKDASGKFEVLTGNIPIFKSEEDKIEFKAGWQKAMDTPCEIIT